MSNGKFVGEPDEIKALIEESGVAGGWTDKENCLTFRTKTGDVLNWYPSTGTYNFQGTKTPDFQAKITAAISAATGLAVKPKNSKTKIFIVHGHDKESRDQLELVLMRLGLQPYILQNNDGGSKTIIEALETHIYKDAAFGIILMTPDDFGYAKIKPDTERQPRARQNVILEMGMVMAALGRDRMAILKKGNLEIPSDTDGIIRLEFNDRVQEIVPKLVQRLTEAGIPVDANKVAAAAA
ncbi:MAG: nucleotide-binding protein [Alphaproteobacteria bacterium]